VVEKGRASIFRFCFEIEKKLGRKRPVKYVQPAPDLSSFSVDQSTAGGAGEVVGQFGEDAGRDGAVCVPVPGSAGTVGFSGGEGRA
jgi:hypothetical protein